MAFDGITINALSNELNTLLKDARITKIAQTEKDELIISLKSYKENYKLLISANASLPLIYMTKTPKTSPLTAPNFCMLLRKHINSGKILSITQPGLERIIEIKIEHYNELGDLCQKVLIIEMMGKHSNIIFCEDNEDVNERKIIDSIKRISLLVSSVREVLPGKIYTRPKNEKIDLLTSDKVILNEIFLIKNEDVVAAIYKSITGISPIIAANICERANINTQKTPFLLKENEKQKLIKELLELKKLIQNKAYKPYVIYENEEPKDFFVSDLSLLTKNEKILTFESVSEMLESYYKLKNILTRIKQKSYDLRRVAQTILDKDIKKLDIQNKQMQDTNKMEKYRLYGELISAYTYDISPQTKVYKAYNYNDETYLDIPLDEDLTPALNSKKYFEKYNRLKRTKIALEEIIKETQAQIDHLLSILSSIDLALEEDDLKLIKEEMIVSGYIKRKAADKKIKSINKPLRYTTKEGDEIIVGKNNLQNDEITFKLATGNDWWFHAKGIPGSHVIVKTMKEELSDYTYELAAKAAGYYSKGRSLSKVEVDYTQKKNIKKPAGSKPGFVVYNSNYSMIIKPDIKELKIID